MYFSTCRSEDEMSQLPLYIRVHPQDNVAIVVNDGGLPEGATFADGLTLRERVPQGHKVALKDLAEGDEVIRYNVVIGYALKNLPKGSWINEHVIRMPSPPGLEGLPIATVKPPEMAPLEGFTFEGLSQRGRHGRLAQHPRDHDDRAMRRRRRPARGRAHQGRAVAALSERRRCRESWAHVRLRRRDRRTRRDGAHPHRAQHQPESEFRRRGDDGQPRLREAAA
jgi:hypothetical protein